VPMACSKQYMMGFIPDVADVNTHITLLSIGLAALAVAALQDEG